MKILVSWMSLVVGGILMSSCGDGEFQVNPTAGEASTASGSTPTPTTAQEYFQQNIFDLMVLGSATKQCIGCHPVNAARAKYFQLNAGDFSASYNFISARKQSVQIGTYADTSAATIADKMAQNHQTFQGWSTEEKAFITTWTAFTP